ncbi:npp1 domain-containing protein [Colletotrichum camelliae]|nr:npp1 domain-containing protein [Colletotrichum camelliae]
MLRQLFHFASFLSFVHGSILHIRDGDIAVSNKWKDHDQITVLQQQTSDGLEGQLELRFKPWLNDASGCFPYAAIDKDGYHGAGLKPVGKSGGSCRDDTKLQLYARSGTSKSSGRTGILYSWYLPKIQTDSENHKHWYLSIVVWVHTDKCEPSADDYRVVGVSYSNARDTYDTSLPTSGRTLYGSGDSGAGPGNTHPIIGYNGQVNVFPSINGAQYALTPPMISWKKLSLSAVEQLNGIQYEHARCPFNDNNIQAFLDAAFNAEFYTGLVENNNCGSDIPTPTDPIEPTEPSALPDLPATSAPVDFSKGWAPDPENSGVPSPDEPITLPVKPVSEAPVDLSKGWAPDPENSDVPSPDPENSGAPSPDEPITLPVKPVSEAPVDFSKGWAPDPENSGVPSPDEPITLPVKPVSEAPVDLSKGWAPDPENSQIPSPTNTGIPP